MLWAALGAFIAAAKSSPNVPLAIDVSMCICVWLQACFNPARVRLFASRPGTARWSQALCPRGCSRARPCSAPAPTSLERSAWLCHTLFVLLFFCATLCTLCVSCRVFAQNSDLRTGSAKRPYSSTCLASSCACCVFFELRFLTLDSDNVCVPPSKRVRFHRG